MVDSTIKEKKLAIIGLGRLGRALAVWLDDFGVAELKLCGRSSEKWEALAARLQGPVGFFAEAGAAIAGCDLVFLAVQDRHIAGLAAALAPLAGSGLSVAHLSGSLTAAVLAPLRQAGARVFSLHPLQSLADAETAVKALPGSWFSFEGDEAALPLARELVDILRGRLVYLRAEDKALYHAAAVVASNFFIALEDLAIRMLAGTGVDEDSARQMLLPLIRGSLANLEELPPAEALTGPIVRGDEATVAAHLEVLAARFPEMLPAYRLLAGLNHELAVRKGTVTPLAFPALRAGFRQPSDS